MSEATPPPRGPRVIVEEAAAPAPRLDFEWEQAVVPVAPPPVLPASRWGGMGRALTGAAVIAGGLAVLSIANFITDQFARGPVQGWLSLGIIGLGAALLLGGAWRELRGLWSIRPSEAARDAFARADLPRAKATEVVDAVFGAIEGALKDGEEVRLVGFGTFAITHRKASKGRDPRTGVEIDIAATTSVRFKAGKGLKDALG